MRLWNRTGFYDGRQQQPEAELSFASIQTLGRRTHLERFDPAHFDYLVVVEFHHAAANRYQALLDHFRPRFLLGLTATPYRADNHNLLSWCDGNIAYRITFLEAVALGCLCPFHYYGLYETDYRPFWRGGRHEDTTVGQALTTRQKTQAVLEAYCVPLVSVLKI